MDYWWNEKIDEWISGQLNGLSSGVMSEWMDEQMDETDKSWYEYVLRYEQFFVCLILQYAKNVSLQIELVL